MAVRVRSVATKSGSASIACGGAAPETLEKGTVIESIVEVKGMLNRIKWTIVHYNQPEAMTLDGVGVGGVKVRNFIGKVKPSGDGSTVTFDVHLGGPALFSHRHGRRRRTEGRHPSILNRFKTVFVTA